VLNCLWPGSIEEPERVAAIVRLGNLAALAVMLIVLAIRREGRWQACVPPRREPGPAPSTERVRSRDFSANSCSLRRFNTKTYFYPL
jgi:hypothetical protein